MTSRYDSIQSVHDASAQQLTLPFPPTVHRRAAQLATRAESNDQAVGVAQPAPPIETDESVDSADDFGSFQDDSISFANTLDQQAYLARRRLLIALVSLVVLGSVLLIGKAVSIHRERVRSASAAPAPQASESRVEAVIASGTAANAVEAVIASGSSTASTADRSTSSAVADRHAAVSGVPRRKRAVHTSRTKSYEKAESASGVPVDQIYVNQRGDLVDPQGEPLHSESSSSTPATSDDATSAP